MAISFDLRSSSAKYRYCNINLIKLVFIFIKNDSHYNLWPHKMYTWTNCYWIQVLIKLTYTYGGTNWWISLTFKYELVVLEKKRWNRYHYFFCVNHFSKCFNRVICNRLIWIPARFCIKVVSVEICIPFYWCSTLIFYAIFNYHQMISYKVASLIVYNIFISIIKRNRAIFELLIFKQSK